jgi:tryptophan synthase alpha chain
MGVADADALDALLDRSGPPALGVYGTAGYPSPNDAVDLLTQCVRQGGADWIELGIPAAHPYLDGPDIAATHTAARRRGVDMLNVFTAVRRLSKVAPVVVMTYYAPLLRYGLAAAAGDLSRAGAAGVLVVDLPEDEAHEWHEEADAAGIHAPRLVEASAGVIRRERLTGAATGFVYSPASAQPTGYQGLLDVPSITRRCAQLRLHRAPPIVIGSGLSRPDLAREVAPSADGVVIGSPLARAMHSHESVYQGIQAACALTAEYARALRGDAQATRRDRGTGSAA